MSKFEPHPHKEEAMQALRNGESADEVRRRFGLGIRTIARYESEIKNPKTPKASTTGGAPPKPGLTSVPIEPSPPREEGPEPDGHQDQQAAASPGQPSRPAAQTRQTVLDVAGPTLVNFRFYNDPVQINLAYLEGAYGDYKKIKRLDPSIEDSFEEAVVGSMRFVLSTLRQKIARQVVAVMEDSDADIGRETAG